MSWAEIKKINSDLDTPLDSYMKPTFVMQDDDIHFPYNNEFTVVEVTGKGILDEFLIIDKSNVDGGNNTYVTITVDGITYCDLVLGYNANVTASFAIYNTDYMSSVYSNGKIYISSSLPRKNKGAPSFILTGSNLILPKSQQRTISLSSPTYRVGSIILNRHGLRFEQSLNIRARVRNSYSANNPYISYYVRMFE